MKKFLVNLNKAMKKKTRLFWHSKNGWTQPTNKSSHSSKSYSKSSTNLKTRSDYSSNTAWTTHWTRLLNLWTDSSTNRWIRLILRTIQSWLSFHWSCFLRTTVFCIWSILLKLSCRFSINFKDLSRKFLTRDRSLNCSSILFVMLRGKNTHLTIRRS